MKLQDVLPFFKDHKNTASHSNVHQKPRLLTSSLLLSAVIQVILAKFIVYTTLFHKNSSKYPLPRPEMSVS
jgi:uncharacterized membrane protein affecting hemolysin expression